MLLWKSMVFLNNEGIALMCLAESLLRIPDKKTRDDLIKEKITSAKWIEHLNQADSLLVNSATWGLIIAKHSSNLLALNRTG